MKIMFTIVILGLSFMHSDLLSSEKDDHIEFKKNLRKSFAIFLQENCVLQETGLKTFDQCLDEKNHEACVMTIALLAVLNGEKKKGFVPQCLSKGIWVKNGFSFE